MSIKDRYVLSEKKVNFVENTIADFRDEYFS